MLALHSRDFWGKNNASFFRTRPVKNSLERMRSVKYYRVITSIGGSSPRVAVPSPWGKTGGGVRLHAGYGGSPSVSSWQWCVVAQEAGHIPACEQAPRNSASEWKSERRDSTSEASGTRGTPSSPDRPRLVPLALDYTRLSRPKPDRTESLFAGYSGTWHWGILSWLTGLTRTPCLLFR